MYREVGIPRQSANSSQHLPWRSGLLGSLPRMLGAMHKIAFTEPHVGSVAFVGEQWQWEVSGHWNRYTKRMSVRFAEEVVGFR